MRVRRLPTALLLGAVAALSFTPAAQAAAKDDGLDLVIPVLAPMLPGQQGWVSALWTAKKDVCDVQVTASGPGMTVNYPANTDTFSSFYVNSALATDTIDYTAFDVTVAPTAASAVPVTLNVTYTQLPPGQIKKGDDLKTEKFDCKGPKGSQTVTTTLPVLAPTGPKVVQKTTSVTVARATPTWTKIAFAGGGPTTGDFRVTLTPPVGLSVTYPGEGTSTGLDAHAALPVAREDFAAVRLDASALAPGSYQVPVRATYAGGTFAGQLTVVVS